MQFIKNGPDIPERLLQAHEDGRVVFFCGAGISYPAGLPGFGGLVDQIFENLSMDVSSVQQAAITAGQYDIAIGLLEDEIVGGRKTVRKELAKILLTPDLKAKGALDTHKALLTLGKCRDGPTRLVTTNFDRLFEKVIEKNSLAVKSFQAPPHKNRWGGLVYLHGLLTDPPTLDDLEHLVISSGDFGRAYLTEGSAARFVSELFRNYTVCFVGYSLNDPVLRYMTDALSTDSLRDESSPEMFAFGGHLEGKEELGANEWRAKNVTPILYLADDEHSYLHKTLQAWGNTYRDGVDGKKRIIAKYAEKDPSTSTKQDDFVGRMLWALSDPSGLPAKLFAEFNPVPSLAWLEPLSEERYLHADLIRFGVSPKKDVNNKLTFSLIHRPSPYHLAPRMMVADDGPRRSQLDKVTRGLTYWLTRHLDDPALLLWLVERGGQLHEELIRPIENRLDQLANLENDGSSED